MIKNILFDLDDTILDFKRCEKEALILSLKEFDIDPSEEIISTYSSINESEWKKFERGETTTAILKVERYKRLLEHFKIDKDYRLLSLAYEKNLSKFYYFIDGAKEMLDTLKGKYHLFLVSNGIKHIQLPRLEGASLFPYFDKVFISEEIGYSKPNPKYFEVVFNLIPHFSKEETLIIGDSLTSDIKGGNDASITTVWFNPHYKKGNIIPTYEVHSHQEFLALLNDLNEKKLNV